MLPVQPGLLGQAPSVVFLQLVAVLSSEPESGCDSTGVFCRLRVLFFPHLKYLFKAGNKVVQCSPGPVSWASVSSCNNSSRCIMGML